MKRKSLLLIACLLACLGAFNLNAQTNLIKGTFPTPLSGNEVVFAELTFTKTASDVNTVFGLGGIATPEYSWGSYAAGFNLNSADIQIKPRNDGANENSGINAISGEKFRVWFGLNVPEQKYTFRVETKDGEFQSADNQYVFRNKTAPTITYYYASSDKTTNFMKANTITTVASVGAYPAEYATDASLENIKLSIGSLSFNPAEDTYNVTLPKGTATVDVTPVTTRGLATTTGAGAISITGGTGKATIKVTSQNGAVTKTYTVNFAVEQQSHDATLSDLQVNGTTVNGFSSSIYNYYVVLPAGSAVPTINAVKNNNWATVNVTPPAQIPGKAVITVTAEAGESQTYYIQLGTNLIAEWNAGATNTLENPSQLANPWYPQELTIWKEAQGSGGIRFLNLNYKYNFEATAKQRTLLTLRWDDPVPVGTHFGFKVNLKACKTYKFTGGFGWHNNASGTSVYTIAINKNADGSGEMYGSTKLTLSEAEARAKNLLFNSGFTFKVPEDGDYYLTIANSIKMMGVVDDLLIMEVDEPLTPSLSASTHQILLLDGVGESKSFAVKGAVNNDVVLTAPAGFALSKTSISKSELDCSKNVNITVSVSNKSTAANGKVYITSGTGETMQKDSINLVYLSASGANKIPFAMGAGSGVTGQGTDPAAFGWKGVSASTDPAKDAIFAVSGSASGNRYNAVTSYFYHPKSNNPLPGDEDVVIWNETGNGWVLFLRWDNSNSNSDSLTVYSYPIDLVAGQTYKLTGKYAWHDNGSENNLAFGINTKPDNSGTMLKASYLEYLSLGNVQKVMMDIVADQATRGDFVFTPTTSGKHYLTIFQDPNWTSVRSHVLCSFADLSIVNTSETSVKNTFGNNKHLISVDNGVIKVENHTDFKVYSVSGALQNPNSRLNAGVYVVSVEGNNYKVIVR